VRKKSVVTGGLGFIGSHVAELLADENHEVLVLDDLSTGNQKNSLPSIHYEIENYQSLTALQAVRKFAPDYIFHLAALPRIQPSYDSPLEYTNVNVIGVIPLLELSRDLNLKGFIYSSSASVYGNPRKQPILESTCINPLNPYAVQKYAAEQLLLMLGERWRVPVVSLRYFNPFGERSFHPENTDSAYSPVVGIFEHAFNNSLPLKVTGDGSQRRDFIYVKDVARANLLSANSATQIQSRIMNVCSGETTSIYEVALMFSNNIEFIPPRKGEAEVSWGCNCTISNQLGWVKSTSLRQYVNKFKSI
jgi:UDP-glucose 4-epimerase